MCTSLLLLLPTLLLLLPIILPLLPTLLLLLQSYCSRDGPTAPTADSTAPTTAQLQSCVHSTAPAADCYCCPLSMCSRWVFCVFTRSDRSHGEVFRGLHAPGKVRAVHRAQAVVRDGER